MIEVSIKKNIGKIERYRFHVGYNLFFDVGPPHYFLPTPHKMFESFFPRPLRLIIFSNS